MVFVCIFPKINRGILLYITIIGIFYGVYNFFMLYINLGLALLAAMAYAAVTFMYLQISPS